MIAWNPHTEKPEHLITALIAVRDDACCFILLPKIYMYKKGRWTDENDDRAELGYEEFWWVSEQDLLSPLMTSVNIEQGALTWPQ